MNKSVVDDLIGNQNLTVEQAEEFINKLNRCGYGYEVVEVSFYNANDGIHLQLIS